MGGNTRGPSRDSITHPPPFAKEKDKTFFVARATFQAYTHGYDDQDENGIDRSLLRENLKRTPTERLEKLRRELAFFAEVRRVRSAGTVCFN